MAECMELSGQMIMPEPFDLDCGLPKQIKEETFTENGSYEIMPDEGFQLEKAKVNVDVFIPEEQEKVLEVQKNGSYEVLPDELKVLSKVSVNVATPEQKKETTFGIGYDKNGKYLIRPQEGYVFSEGMVDINVPSQIDLTQIGFTETQNEVYNRPMLNGIEYAKAIQRDWVDTSKPEKLDANRLVFFPKVELTKAKSFLYYFRGFYNLEAVAEINAPNAEELGGIFNDCPLLKNPILIKAEKAKSAGELARYCSRLKGAEVRGKNLTYLNYAFDGCRKMKFCIFESIENCSNFTNMFWQCFDLEFPLILPKWKKGNISLSQSSKIFLTEIKGIIDQALTAPENVRSLTLNSAVGQKFEQEPDFAEYQALASSKGITIQW